MIRGANRRCAAAGLACVLGLCGCADSGLPEAGEARLVKDLQDGSSDPNHFLQLGRIALFATNDGRGWRSDGTPAGTMRVSDAGSQVAPAGATRFYQGVDDAHGAELWKTDGTAAGTVLVKDINPGPRRDDGGSSYPLEFTEAAGATFFVACDGAHGWELWRTDGTDAGTAMVKDIDPRAMGRPDSDGCLSFGWRPQHLREYRGMLYFLGDDGADALGLWRSDGTAEGTWLVKAVPRVGPTNPRDVRADAENLTNAAGRLFFTTRANLWSSDGEGPGTMALPPVADAVVAGTPSLFFYLSESGVGRSDGTAAGTYTVSDVYVPTNIRFNSRLTQVSVAVDRLFFVAGGSQAGLWTSDGTPAGTRPVQPGPHGVGAGPFSLVSSAGGVYYVAEDARLGRQLWRVQGGGPAERLTEIEGQVAHRYDDRDENAIGVAGPLILFPGNDDHGTELWAYRTR